MAIGGTVAVGAAAGYAPIAGAGLVLALGLGFVLLRYPVAAGVILVGVVPAVAGLKRGLIVPGFRVSELVVVGLGLLILLPLEARRAVRWQSFDWLALTYAVATGVLGYVDLAGRGAHVSSTDLGTMLGPLQYLILYRAIVTVVRTPDQQRRALRLLILISAAVSLLAIAQQIGVPGMRSFLATITGSKLYGSNPTVSGVPLSQAPRASGPFPFWHETGGYLMIILTIGIGLALEGSGRILRLRWLVPILLLDAAALVETVTIAPIVVGIVGVIAVGWWARLLRVSLALLAAGALVFGLIYLPQLSARSAQQFGHAPGTTVTTTNPLVPETIAYRIKIFDTQDLPLLRGHWLTGYGPSLPNTYSFDFTESLYFTLLLRGGIVLLAIYLALMWALFSRARATARTATEPEQRLVARVTMLMVVMLVFVHFIESYFVDTGPGDLIWVLAALVAVGPDPRLARSPLPAGRRWLRARGGGVALARE